jgi:phosphoglycerol transferase
VLAALIGASSGYYATFTLVLLGLAALVQAAHDRRLAPLVSAVLPAAVIAVVLVANLVPALVYAHDHGGGAIGHRQPYEAETYGLKLTQLVMPVEGHRLEPLARLKDRSLKGPVHDELGMSLGAVGAIGFVVLVGLALGALAGVRPPASALRRRLSMLTVLAVLVATVSGVSYLLALFGLTTIRVWERIVVFISLFSLCAMATLADDLRARWRGRRWGAPAVAAALAVVTVIGVLDQTTNADIPDYPARRREFASDAAFVHALERRLPPRAMVFQLPYMPFPDSPNVGDVFSFDLFRLYLHSTTLRWSYGGAEGREAEWQPRWLAQPQERQLEGLTAVGFQGLTLDRRAWGDHGAATEAGIAATLGEAPYASPDGTMSFFDLRPLAERTRAALGAAGVAALRRETLSGARPG